MHDLLWYLGYPLRDLYALNQTVDRVATMLGDDDAKAKDLPVEDWQRVGALVAAPALAIGVAILGVNLAYRWELVSPEIVPWAPWLSLALWYVLTRESRRTHDEGEEQKAIAAHANTKIKSARGHDVLVRDAWYDLEGICKFNLHYPDWLEDSKPSIRNGIEEHLRGKLSEIDKESKQPKRLWLAEWSPRPNFVTFEVPQLPNLCRPVIDHDLPWHKVLIGPGNHDKQIIWDLKLFPHMLLVAPTGTGKTSATRAIISQIYAAAERAERRGDKPWLQWGFDPKRIGLKFMRGRPHTAGVATSYEAMAEFSERIEHDMDAWYEQAENSAVMPALLNYFVIVEEFAHLAELDGTTENKLGPVSSRMASIGRLGREAGIHMLVIIQQPRARFLSTEFRDNLAGRGALGPIPGTASEMTFNDHTIGQTIPVHPGRSLFQFGPMHRELVQVPWVSDPDRLDLDLSTKGMDPQRELELAAAVFPPKSEQGVTSADDDWRGPEMMT